MVRRNDVQPWNQVVGARTSEVYAASGPEPTTETVSPRSGIFLVESLLEKQTKIRMLCFKIYILNISMYTLDT